MFRNLLAPKSRPRLQPARAPAAACLYAIGDIHGRADLLRAIHARILADARGTMAQRKVVIYLGDYIDRGLESREVIDVLLDEPLPGFESIHLKGNHEQALLDFLVNPSIGPDWFTYGGDATLYSYKVPRPTKGAGPYAFKQARIELERKLPPRHLAFYRSLALSRREGNYLFVHAGVKPGVAIDSQDAHDLMWIRDEFLESDADHGCIVVHGHTIAPRPVVKSNRIGIDTGAFATGRLTCLRLEDDERMFLTT